MPWLLASPGHQQPWHLLYRIIDWVMVFHEDEFQQSALSQGCVMIKNTTLKFSFSSSGMVSLWSGVLSPWLWPSSRLLTPNCRCWTHSVNSPTTTTLKLRTTPSWLWVSLELVSGCIVDYGSRCLKYNINGLMQKRFNSSMWTMEFCLLH